MKRLPAALLLLGCAHADSMTVPEQHQHPEQYRFVIPQAVTYWVPFATDEALFLLDQFLTARGLPSAVSGRSGSYSLETNVQVEPEVSRRQRRSYFVLNVEAGASGCTTVEAWWVLESKGPYDTEWMQERFVDSYWTPTNWSELLSLLANTPCRIRT